MFRLQPVSHAPATRIALLTPDLDIRQLRRLLNRSWAVAGGVALLRRLANAVESGGLTLPPIEAAVIVLTGISHGELTALERDLFWRVFQVPVFEQFLSPDARVLAMECDAHEGLHVLEPKALPPGYRAVLQTTPCGCGDPHPRLFWSQCVTLPSLPASRVRSAVPAYVYDDRDEENQQVGPGRRVA